MMVVENRIDVERWLPERWDQIVANEDLVEFYQDNLRSFLAGEKVGLNGLILGKSRSGKTAITKLFARCLLCERLDTETLNPCRGNCRSCQEDASRYGLSGLEVYVREGSVHYLPIDCTSIVVSELRETLTDLRDYDGVRVVYLDEVHRLHRQIMDEQLLKPVEERNFMWIASSASTKGLEKMFKNRFVKIRTSQPTPEQLAFWLGQRCKEWNVNWDESDTLFRLAERTDCVPGLALQVLARASKKPDRTVSRRLVERYIFDDEED